MGRPGGRVLGVLGRGARKGGRSYRPLTHVENKSERGPEFEDTL